MIIYNFSPNPNFFSIYQVFIYIYVCRYIYIYIYINLFIWLHQILIVARGIISCGMWGLVPQLGMELRPPALGAWSHNHWVTKEAPVLTKSFLMLYNIIQVKGIYKIVTILKGYTPSIVVI